MKLAALWVGAFPTLIACSGESMSSGAPEGSAGRGGNSATGGSGAVPANDPSNFACLLDQRCTPGGERQDPLPPPSCPASEPSEGEPCETGEGECSYGDSVAAYCRSYFACVEGSWQVPSTRRGTCATHPEGFCPARPEHAASCTVGNVDVYVPCEYPNGVSCYCLGNPVGRVGATSTWECYAPPTNPACPELLPNLGDGCAENGQSCHYGIVQQGCFAPYADVYCFQGAWEASFPVCTL